MIRYVFILLIFFAIYGCTEKEGINPESKNYILGNWSYAASDTLFYKQGLSIFEKTTNFDENQFGYQFTNNGQLSVRSIAGWCATPPTFFATYKGEWKMKDSTLYLNYESWNGQIATKWQIIKLDKKELIVRKL